MVLTGGVLGVKRVYRGCTYGLKSYDMPQTGCTQGIPTVPNQIPQAESGCKSWLRNLAGPCLQTLHPVYTMSTPCLHPVYTSTPYVQTLPVDSV